MSDQRRFTMPTVPQMKWQQVRKEWALLNTIDALSAKHDQPLTFEEVRNVLHSAKRASTLVSYGSNRAAANIIKAQ